MNEGSESRGLEVAEGVQVEAEIRFLEQTVKPLDNNTG